MRASSVALEDAPERLRHSPRQIPPEQNCSEQLRSNRKRVGNETGLLTFVAGECANGGAGAICLHTEYRSLSVPLRRDRPNTKSHIAGKSGLECPVRSDRVRQNLRGDTDLGRVRAAISGAAYAHLCVDGAETQKPPAIPANGDRRLFYSSSFNCCAR